MTKKPTGKTRADAFVIKAAESRPSRAWPVAGARVRPALPEAIVDLREIPRAVLRRHQVQRGMK